MSTRLSLLGQPAGGAPPPPRRRGERLRERRRQHSQREERRRAQQQGREEGLGQHTQVWGSKSASRGALCASRAHARDGCGEHRRAQRRSISVLAALGCGVHWAVLCTGPGGVVQNNDAAQCSRIPKCSSPRVLLHGSDSASRPREMGEMWGDMGRYSASRPRDLGERRGDVGRYSASGNTRVRLRSLGCQTGTLTDCSRRLLACFMSLGLGAGSVGYTAARALLASNWCVERKRRRT